MSSPAITRRNLLAKRKHSILDNEIPSCTRLLRRTGIPGAVMVLISTREYDSSIL